MPPASTVGTLDSVSGLKRSTSPQIFLMLSGIAPSGSRQDDKAVAAGERRQCLSERAADVVQRHAEKQIGARFRLEQQIYGPRLVDLVAVGVPDKLRRARGAAGVEVSRNVIR